jgi:hypothetical protein
MTTTFEKLYRLAESMGSSNDEMYLPQPFGQDPEHQSTMDPVDPEPLEITQPKEDGNQFTGSKKTADISNTDENPSPGNISAPKSVYKIDVEAPPEQQLFGDAGETSRGDGSIIMSSLTLNPESRKIVNAFVMENGAPKCSVCNEYYTPKSIAQAKLAHCGHCPEDNPDANKIEEGDVVDGDVVKTGGLPWTKSSGPRCSEGHKMKPDATHTEEKPSYFCPTCWGTTGDEYEKLEQMHKRSKREASTKTSNDSELYTRGFLDHMHGKPLDEDLAVLSDDYFNGYDQARYYGKTPLESVGAKPHTVTIPASTDTSLDGWQPIDRIDHKYDIDRNEIIASTLPTNVLEAFFNTEE